jgi:hypothetical protein
VSGIHSWRDKPVAEAAAAKLILEHANVKVESLVSRASGQDPPDCEGVLDGNWSGVEVTELVHRPTLERSIKAVRQRSRGVDPERAEAYFVWEREDLVKELQARLDEKDNATLKGSGYERYVLVILTDEFFLDRESVEVFLQGASFNAKRITDAFFGLSL